MITITAVPFLLPQLTPPDVSPTTIIATCSGKEHSDDHEPSETGSSEVVGQVFRQGCNGVWWRMGSPAVT